MARLRRLNPPLRTTPPAMHAPISLGLLQLAKGDSAAAEFAFKKAVESDPKSVNARLALANYYWSTNRRDTAEATLKERPRWIEERAGQSGLGGSSTLAPAAKPRLKRR